MNAWQMSPRAPLKWRDGGGCATDQGDMKNGIPPKQHYSIHRFGRDESYRRKQRQRRQESAAARYQARRAADIARNR